MARMTNLPSVNEAELRDALTKCGGSVTLTAVYLGVHRVTVHRLMKRYGIKRRMIVA